MRRLWILWRRMWTEASERMKQWLLEYSLMKRRVTLLPGCKITGINGVEFGEDILISHQAFIQGAGGISFGSRIMVGPRVMLISTGHDLVTRHSMSHPIVIEDDVWLGAGCTVLAGVRIGRGSVVGAGAVVTKSIEPYSVAVGVPARVFKKIVSPTSDGYFSAASWRGQFE